MAKTAKETKLVGTRTYALSKETKGCWLYSWENAPADTPDWAKKWYLLKSEFATNPGPKIVVMMQA
jgi:hypothetical protein